MKNIKQDFYDEIIKIKQEIDISNDDFHKDQNEHHVDDEGPNEYQVNKGQNAGQNNKYQVYEGNKAYRCESCGKSFTGEGYLKHHINTVHEVEYQVNEHEEQNEYIVNEGKKEYQCDICNFSSSYNVDLKFHMKSVHEGKCNECGKIYSNPGRLKKHLLSVHQANKFQINVKPFPYECNLCGKTFSTAYYIKYHIGKKSFIEYTINLIKNYPNSIIFAFLNR